MASGAGTTERIWQIYTKDIITEIDRFYADRVTACAADDAPINANKLVNAVYEWYIQEKWAVTPPQVGKVAFLGLTKTGIPNATPTIATNITNILDKLENTVTTAPSFGLFTYLSNTNSFYAGRCYGLTLKERKAILVNKPVLNQANAATQATNHLNFYNPIIDHVVQEHAVSWYTYLSANNYIYNLYDSVIPSYLNQFTNADLLNVGADLVPRLLRLWQKQPLTQIDEEKQLKLGYYGTYPNAFAGSSARKYDLLGATLDTSTKNFSIKTGTLAYAMSGAATGGVTGIFPETVFEYTFFEPVALEVVGSLGGVFAEMGITLTQGELVLPAFFVNWVVHNYQQKQNIAAAISLYNLATNVVPVLRAGRALQLFSLAATGLDKVLNNPSPAFTSYLNAHQGLKDALNGVGTIVSLAQLSSPATAGTKIMALKNILDNFADLKTSHLAEYNQIKKFLKDADNTIGITNDCPEFADIKTRLLGNTSITPKEISDAITKLCGVPLPAERTAINTQLLNYNDANIASFLKDVVQSDCPAGNVCDPVKTTQLTAQDIIGWKIIQEGMGSANLNSYLAKDYKCVSSAGESYNFRPAERSSLVSSLGSISISREEFLIELSAIANINDDISWRKHNQNDRDAAFTWYRNNGACGNQVLGYTTNVSVAQNSFLTVQKDARDGARTAFKANTIKANNKVLIKAIIDASEVLGEAAADAHFVTTQGYTKLECTFGSGKQGFFDRVYTKTTGSVKEVIVVECKGGTSPLGCRGGNQQGTKEYMNSIIDNMVGKIQLLPLTDNFRITSELLDDFRDVNNLPIKDPNKILKYVLVRQPFNTDGSLQQTQIKQFQIIW